MTPQSLGCWFHKSCCFNIAVFNYFDSLYEMLYVCVQNYPLAFFARELVNLLSWVLYVLFKPKNICFESNHKWHLKGSAHSLSPPQEKRCARIKRLFFKRCPEYESRFLSQCWDHKGRKVHLSKVTYIEH